MRHKVSGKKLGRDIKRRKALFKNLITSFISHGEIKTTEAKAKAVKGLVDKLMTKAKKGTLHTKRQVLSFLAQKQPVEKLFKEIAPRFKNRQSGFTRTIKLGPRRGDNALMVLMEWTDKAKNEKLPARNATHSVAGGKMKSLDKKTKKKEKKEKKNDNNKINKNKTD